MQKKIFFIWIWWIWISALARYYNEIWYEVHWSDNTNSELVEKLQSEWIVIYIWEKPENIKSDFSKIIYTEAIPETNLEYIKALELNLDLKTYPEALWEIANNKKLIAISWTHWKSTTTSLASILLKNSSEDFTSIVWTILKEFDWKNFYHRNNNNSNNPYFLIEACEYKRSFLNYKPSVVIITNIEIDHLDYYKDEKDYISAYEQLINNIVKDGFVILNWEEKNSKSLIWQRKDINYIVVYNDYFSFNGQEFPFPKIDIKIPWRHILYDAKLVYILWTMIWIEQKNILKSLSLYNWVWRRMENIWQTVNNNVLLSDYWHHPTEISLTLEAIKKSNLDKKILTVFQPHQYSRTIELIDSFKDCFWHTDELIIPNIYESRDTKKDKEKMTTQILVDTINHNNKINWNWLNNTLKLINDFDKKNQNSIIILMWAWNVDSLREKIKTT